MRWIVIVHRAADCGFMFVGFVASTSKEKMQVRKNEATQDVLTWKLQKEHCRRHEFPKKYVIKFFLSSHGKDSSKSTSCVFLRCLCSPVKQEHEEVAEKRRRARKSDVYLRRYQCFRPPLFYRQLRITQVSFDRQSNLFADCRHPSTKSNKDLMRE